MVSDYKEILSDSAKGMKQLCYQRVVEINSKAGNYFFRRGSSC